MQNSSSTFSAIKQCLLYAGVNTAVSEYPNCYVADPQPVNQVSTGMQHAAHALQLTLSHADMSSVLDKLHPALHTSCMPSRQRLLARIMPETQHSKAGSTIVRHVLQTGSYLPGQQIQDAQMLPEYSVFPYADLQHFDDMNPTLGSCFPEGSSLETNETLAGLVTSCAQSNTLCCYSANAGDQASIV